MIKMVLAIALFSVAGYLLYKEYKANKKRNNIQRLKSLVHKNNTKASAINEAGVLAGGAVGLSLLEVYATIERHSDVLAVLEQRFPNENGGNEFIDWINKIESLFANNNGGIDTYVSCFKGQAAENMAVSLLQGQGMNVQLFDSLTHPSDDIAVITDDGEVIPVSVKCGDVEYVQQCIENSESQHFIINMESYRVLESRGLIEYYDSHGIEVINGEFSDVALSATAENAFYEIHDSVDISDNIPYLALALLGVKTYKNINRYKDGKMTGREFETDVAMDILKVGAGGALAYVGSNVGGYIGTMIFPGMGTIIGAGVGAFVGALCGNSFIEKTKERLKWGDIIDAQDYFGEKCKEHFDRTYSQFIVEKYLGTKDIDVALKKEIAIADKYSKALNPYDSTEVHLSAVLSQEYIKSLESLKLRIKQVEYRLGKNVIETCRAVAQTVGEKKAEIYGKRLLGELIITNVEDDMLFSTKERNIIKKYDSQKAKAGNYPYQFSESPEIVMERIVKQTFNQTTTEENEIEIRQCLQIIGIVLCCCLGILVWFL